MSSRGQDLGFYREVPTILAELRRRKIHIAAASRTSAPELYVHPVVFLHFKLFLIADWGLREGRMNKEEEGGRDS